MSNKPKHPFIISSRSKHSNRKTLTNQLSQDNYDLLLESVYEQAILINHNFEIEYIFDLASNYLQPKNGKAPYNINDMIHKDIQAPLSTALTQAKRQYKEIQYTNITIKDQQLLITLSIKPLITNEKNINCYLLQFKPQEKSSNNHIAQETYRDNFNHDQFIKDLEYDLQQTEIKYSQLYHSAPDMYASVDPKTRKVIQCNNTAVNILGYSQATDIIGKDVIELYHPICRKEAKQAFKTFSITGKVANTELVLQDKNGNQLPVILKVNAIRNETGKIIYSMSSWKDIREIKALRAEKDLLKKSEQLFKENEFLYNTILDSVTDGWWDLNLETNEEYMSPSLKSVFGYKDHEVKNHIDGWKGIINPEDLNLASNNIKNHIETDGKYPYQQEVRYTHKDGSTVWVICRGVAIKDQDGIYRRMVGTHTDITELKRLEIEQKETNAFLEMILNSSDDYIFVKDQDYKIVRANQAFLSAYPVAMQNKVIGYTTAEQYSKADADKFFKYDKIAFEKGCSQTYEHIDMPNGEHIILHTVKKRFYDKNNLPYILGIARNVSEREHLIKKLEESNLEFESTNKQLLQLNKDYQIKINELTEINNDITQLLNTSHNAILFLNQDLTIKRYSTEAEKLFNISKKCLGESILKLNRKVNFNLYIDFINQALNKRENVLKEIKLNNGRQYILKILPYLDDKQNLQGCILNFIDITDLKMSEQIVKDNQNILQLAAQNASIGIWNWLIQDDYLEWNEGMYRLFPIPKQDFHPLYNSFLQCIVPEDRDGVNDSVTKAVSNKTSYHKEYRIYGHNNRVKYIRAAGEFYPGRNGKSDRLTGICIDITPIKQAEVKLDKMARYDSVTGIANREHFLTETKIAVARAKRFNRRLALFFLDLDNFKQVNDSYGHAFGDELLREVISRLEKVIREIDMIGRIGGDEFAILIEEADSIEEIRMIANRCLESVSQVFNIKDKEVHQSFSLGISLYPTAQNVDDLLQYADTAMYRAKEKGKNNFVFFRDELDKKMQRANKLEYALRRPISDNQFYLLYQPQYNNINEMIGVEALIRWDNKELNHPSPDEFIPITEKTRRIIEIGSWVLNQAISEFLTFPKKLQDNLSLSINLSSVQLLDDNIIKATENIIKKHGINPNKLIFEITETHLMNQIDRATNHMQQLSQLGIKFSLDDFGKGYSSLNYLANLPISYLKIDKDFITNLNKNNNKLIVNTMVTLSKSLGMSCVAEGVENQEHLDYLKSINCNKYQGFYFSKPLASNALIKSVK